MIHPLSAATLAQPKGHPFIGGFSGTSRISCFHFSRQIKLFPTGRTVAILKDVRYKPVLFAYPLATVLLLDKRCRLYLLSCFQR